jgi:cardiolipin synthase
VNQPCLTPNIQDTSVSIRFLAEQAFSRITGASLTCGNRVSLLKDAAENYPAWLDALRSARKTIHFETYIIHEDDIGWQFAEVLANKAREGVRVRILYDWMGALVKVVVHRSCRALVASDHLPIIVDFHV